MSPPYEFLGDIPYAIRQRAFSHLNSSGRLYKTFLDVTRRYVEPEGLLEHILAGPWVDVNDAVDDLTHRISARPFLAQGPRNLLLEDYPEGGIRDIVKSPKIGPMIASFGNLNVVILAKLDLSKASRAFRSTFWTSVQAATFRLQALEIVQCTLSARQLAWLVSIFAKEQIDNLRLWALVFSEQNGAVARALKSGASKRPLRVRDLNVSIDSFSSTRVFSVLLDLPIVTFATRKLELYVVHITPNIMSRISDFLRQQHVEVLRFDVSESVTIENPYQLQNTPIRLTGLKEFHFTCLISNEVWNVGLLMLFRATLQRYRNTGLNWIYLTLYHHDQDYASADDVMRAPVPQPNELWTSIEDLMDARPDIRRLTLGVGWFSKDNRVHGGRLHDTLQDPQSSPYLLRDYHLVSLGSHESRRQLLRGTIWSLFPKMLPRLGLVQTQGPRRGRLLFEMGCNDGQVPAKLSIFSGRL